MDVPQMTLGDRWIWTNRVYGEMILKIVRVVKEEYGQEGKEAVGKALYEVGREVGNRLRELLNITGDTAEDYVKLHYYQDTNYWAIKEKVIPGKDGKMTIRASYCPLKGIFTAKDCAVFVPYVRGMMDTINPRLKWTANKVLSRGDDCCEFIVSVEG